MAEPRHPTLERQLRRLGLDAVQPEPAWAQLLERVSRAYSDADQGQYLLERSQDVVSKEMSELYTALRASQDRLSSLLSLSSDWVWEQDATLRFTYVSKEIERLGFDTQLVVGQLARIRMLPAVQDHDPDEHEARLTARLPFRNFIYGVTTPQGQPVYLRVSGEPIFEQGEFKGYRGVGSDVTQATLNAQAVQRLARFDVLTELPNRGMFMDQLHRAVAMAQHTQSEFAVCFIDLDRFKGVNDTLGHFAGDELLRVMGTRLRSLLRPGDLVARLGGDEFVLLLAAPVDTDFLTRLAERALHLLSEPLRLGEHVVQVSGSMGLSLYPGDGGDAPSLLKHADAAMYLAKSRGRNKYQFFSHEISDRTAEFFALEADLRLGVTRDELRLHYQPKFDLASGALCGMEALMRWQHPTRGLLAPGTFIGLAEESGLIVPMGRWLLREACRQIRTWLAEGLPVPRVAINLSLRQFLSETLFEDICAALSEAELPTEALELEITESVLMADPDSVERELMRLHELGVHLAIDDFGTGYSSLAYLKRFPARTLKLDRSFVSGLPGDRDDCAITQAVIAMAHSLGRRVVAEGVETQAQLDYLRALGCDEIQGFLLGRPMPPAAFAELLRAPG